MKKLLLVALFTSAVAFGAATKPAEMATKDMPGMNHSTEHKMMGKEGCSMMEDCASTVMGKDSCPMMQEGKNGMMDHKNMMSKHLSEADQGTLTKNREEIKKITASEKPDWNKVGKLNEENAKIMAKMRTKMMKENHEMKMPVTPAK